MRSESGKGRGRRSTRSITEKIAVLAPTPNESAAIATRAKAGLFHSTRIEWRRSNTKFRMPVTTARTRSGSRKECCTMNLARRAHPVRGKGRSPPFVIQYREPSFGPIMRTTGDAMKGGRHADRFSAPAAGAPQFTSLKGSSQGPAARRRGEIPHQSTVPDCASVRFRELGETESSPRIEGGGGTTQAGHRHE